MGYKLKRSIKLSELAGCLGLGFSGKNIEIIGVSSFDDCAPGYLSFTGGGVGKSDAALIVSDTCKLNKAHSCGYITSRNLRFDFIRALTYLDSKIGFDTYGFKSIVHPSVKLGLNVVIEDGCILDENVELEHNVIIHRGTRIGRNTLIRSGSSIGGQGFGFERNPEDNSLLRFPQIGGVLIGSNVEIGSLNSVSCGALTDTIINDSVKTDNLVHIGHNCSIGKGSLITACAEFSGGVHLGENTWVGPNVSIMQKVSIGDEAVIGLGAVVTKDVPAKTVFAGNPARKFKDI